MSKIEMTVKLMADARYLIIRLRRKPGFHREGHIFLKCTHLLAIRD